MKSQVSPFEFETIILKTNNYLVTLIFSWISSLSIVWPKIQKNINLRITFFPLRISGFLKFAKWPMAVQIRSRLSCWIFWYIILFSTSYAKVIAVLLFHNTFLQNMSKLSFFIFLTSRCCNITTTRRIFIFEVFIIFFHFFQN